MKKNILNGICAAAVCMVLTTLTPNNQAQAATTNPGDKASAAYFQDSTMQRGKMNNNKMGKSKMGGKMNSDSTGKMGNMKGKSSGGYKNKGMGKSKMDTTTTNK